MRIRLSLAQLKLKLPVGAELGNNKLLGVGRCDKSYNERVLKLMTIMEKVMNAQGYDL